ncbi:cohesin subunit SA-3 isoform X1 [Tachysurus fulvidraco]|uniref:cohesin subunit SA-3 isoform X1 n=1 Tax=Tachysurus fulvidraco TaxID=1234273 RepID=UPI000F4F6A65|nr:cohesin subunit SA-3 isoform X1 [Tachysurus fulvidraco]XP_027027589.1 cohesin subunit SA-3 isoform X1 [Tachysurus fulvidraco]
MVLAESDLESLSPVEPDDDLGSDEEFEPNMKNAKRKRGPALGATLSKGRRRRTDSSTSSSLLTHTSSHTPKHTLTPQPDMAGTDRRKSGNMFEAVISGRSALVTVVDDWLADYKQDQSEGLLELMNFVVECCGCKGIVTREMFDRMQNADIIGHLTKEFNEDSVSYPLSAGGSQGRRFHDGLREFVYQLVQRCRNSLLYDEIVFSALIAFLTGLADSQVRAFRHTSTLIAMHLMSAIVAVSAVVCAQADTTQRRYQLEKSKSAALRATERMEELHNSYNELLEQQEELRSLMNGIFKGVFVHRYRDKVPEIRAVCMEEMGVWLRENPTSFLNDGHLKYLGWMLHDKQPSVRLQCVLSLQKLYKEKSFIGRLELFTSRFKERILNMVLDKDPDVAVEAVRLLCIIKQMTEDGLTEEECMRVYPLVFAAHRGLASAAGVFLYHELRNDVNHLLEEGGKESPNVTFLNLLTCFFIQSKYHEHAAYLVDSLWGVAVLELRDWETMTSLLLQENGEEQGLNDDEEAALIELMMCAVRQAAEGTPPIARALGKKNLKARKQQTQERKRITNHFIPLLPQLLTKFSADVDKVVCLLKAPLHFDLDVYSSTGRLEKYLELLLSQVCEIVEKHHEERVLEACVRVLCVLCCDQYTFSVRAERVVSQLLDSILERFNTHLADVLQGTADEDDVYSTVFSLKRLAIFSSARDLTLLKLFEPCFLLLKIGVESREVETELMICALKCAVFHLLWVRVKISQTPQPDKTEVKNLLKQLHSFCEVCQSCLSLSNSLIRNQAFECVCDILVVFGQGKGRDAAALSMCVSPDDTLRAEMASFLIDYIFTDPEDDDTGVEEEAELKIMTLQLRRNQLAGYCKLIIFGVLELRAAADVFKHYSKFYRDFGDIIKETLSKTKVMSPVESARTICLSLQQLYFSLGDEGHDEDMRDIRDLAKKLAMSFGVTLQHIRQPLIALHQDGIRFALREADASDHPNLRFLEILSEFSHKLLKQDRAQLLNYVHSSCEKAGVSVNAVCVSMYERSLRSGSREAPAVSPPHTPAKRRRTSEIGSLSSSLDTPALTSTVIQSRVAHAHQRSRTPSTEFSTDQPSEDDFVEGSIQRKVMPSQREHQSSEHSDVQSQLNMLSLIEENFEEEDEPDIEDYDDEDSDGLGAVSLPSTRHSTSFLEDLFE